MKSKFCEQFNWVLFSLPNTFSEYGTISPELSFINITAFTAALVGGIRSGNQQAFLANESFKRSNEITLYEYPKEAGRKMADSTYLGFFRGLAKGAFRYGVFCFSLAYVRIVFWIIKIT